MSNSLEHKLEEFKTRHANKRRFKIVFERFKEKDIGIVDYWYIECNGRNTPPRQSLIDALKIADQELTYAGRKKGES